MDGILYVHIVFKKSFSDDADTIVGVYKTEFLANVVCDALKVADADTISNSKQFYTKSIPVVG